MAQQWYWMQDGQKNGPVDTAGLKELARTGELKPTDTIWREGLPNWVLATQAKGLFVVPAPALAAVHGGTEAAPATVTPVQAPAATRAGTPKPSSATPPKPPMPVQTETLPQSPVTTVQSPVLAMPHQNLYRVLNLPQTASAADLKKAINQALRLWSNRSGAHDMERRQEAERMVKLLEQAETILLDAAQRTSYDHYLTSVPPEEQEIGESDLADKDDLVCEARRLLTEGEIPDALFVAEKATQRDGNNAEAWAVLAEAKFRWGDTEDAIYEYKRAIKLRPNEATYYFDFGSVLDSADRREDALQQYQRAAQIDPATTMYRAAVGAVLVRLEKYTEGIDILEQCRREQPDNPTYQWFLAIAYDDSSILGWTHVDEGHPLLTEGWYATEFKHVTDSQECLNKALSLKFDDPDLMSQLQERRRRIDEMLQRKLKCNWGVAVIVGLIGIPLYGIPTVLAILYVISTYTPQYRINKQLVMGKHFNQFAFMANLMPKNAGAIGTILGVCILYSLIILLIPFVVGINVYRNWINK